MEVLTNKQVRSGSSGGEQARLRRCCTPSSATVQGCRHDGEAADGVCGGFGGQVELHNEIGRVRQRRRLGQQMEKMRAHQRLRQTRDVKLGNGLTPTKKQRSERQRRQLAWRRCELETCARAASSSPVGQMEEMSSAGGNRGYLGQEYRIRSVLLRKRK